MEKTIADEVFSLSTRSSQAKQKKVVSKAIKFEQLKGTGWANVAEGGLWLFRISFLATPIERPRLQPGERGCCAYEDLNQLAQ